VPPAQLSVGQRHAESASIGSAIREGGDIRFFAPQSGTGQPKDPAESWELPSTGSEEGTFFRGILEVFPHTPRRADDVPAAAQESLRNACGVEGLSQLFIIPRAVRSTGCRDQKVIAPYSVLAIGSRALGLWTEKPEPGVKALIPLERVSAIEDVTILLYGRLSFISFGINLTVRYNTLARFGLVPALLRLRRLLSGSPQPIPRDDSVSPELPFKWKRALQSAWVRLDEDAPVAFRFAYAPRKSRDDIERGQLLVLNPHELVYMCDPESAPHHYGADSFILPRSRITSVRVREDKLEINSNGARFSSPMMPGLTEGAARWFA
jgi:hypothetical protein